MLGRNGTGPMGLGTMTGRGLGSCTGMNTPMQGRKFRNGCGRGFGAGAGVETGAGRGLGFGTNSNYNQTSSKEVLEAQKEQLKNRLDAIAKQLEKF